MEKKWGIHAIIRNRENIISVVMSGVLALIFGFHSPLHPWVGGGAPTDSSVFKTMALMMEHGYMPYRDSFDHKGPFLNILNWLGNRISNYRGIWVIEIVVIGLTFFMMYKIARLSCSIVASIITTLTATSLLFIYYGGGNYTKEYAMSCIAIGIYIFLDYLKNDIISYKRLIISGMCWGIVLLLRPNMISVWIVYCLTIAIVLVFNKRIKNLSNLVIWFVVGLVIMIIPTLIWLTGNGALDYCFRDYIVFNMEYVVTGGERALFSSRWDAFLAFCSPVYAISAISTIFLCVLLLYVGWGMRDSYVSIHDKFEDYRQIEIDLVDEPDFYNDDSLFIASNTYSVLDGFVDYYSNKQGSRVPKNIVNGTNWYSEENTFYPSYVDIGEDRILEYNKIYVMLAHNNIDDELMSFFENNYSMHTGKSDDYLIFCRE